MYAAANTRHSASTRHSFSAAGLTHADLACLQEWRSEHLPIPRHYNPFCPILLGRRWELDADQAELAALSSLAVVAETNESDSFPSFYSSILAYRYIQDYIAHAFFLDNYVFSPSTELMADDVALARASPEGVAALAADAVCRSRLATVLRA